MLAIISEDVRLIFLHSNRLNDVYLHISCYKTDIPSFNRLNDVSHHIA